MLNAVLNAVHDIFSYPRPTVKVALFLCYSAGKFTYILSVDEIIIRYILSVVQDKISYFGPKSLIFSSQIGEKFRLYRQIRTFLANFYPCRPGHILGWATFLCVWPNF